MRSFAVIGAGTMGSGIAQKIALEGRPVTVVDVSEAALERGRSLMEAIFTESVERGLLDEPGVAAVRKRVRWSTDLADAAGADLVIEAVFEDLELKRRLFADLERVTGPETVLATNTSSFRVREVAARMERPERVVGLHFFYHPVKNRLLEVIPWDGTSAAAAETAERFAALLGKVALRCPDSPGFVVNRFFVPWLNEAVRVVEEGVADIPTVEATARERLRLGMGPFELMNVTGVSIARHAAEGLAAELGPFYAPAAALVRQAEAGPWSLEGEGAPSQAVLDRLLAAVWVVAAALVEEGGATPLDVDLGARVGLRWRRGPFELWNRTDPAARRRALEAFSVRHPDVPVPRLLAAGGEVELPAVTAERRDGATVVWLARPDRSNALDGQLFEDLARCVAAAGGPLVVRGMGKNFAAGADIRFFLRAMEAGELGRIVAVTRRAQEILAALEDHPHRTVAAVDGFALGGGAELMLCCDVAVATPRARIGFPETGIGIYPGLGGCHRLVRRVGRGLARFLVGTGTTVGGEDAATIGLVDACLPPEELVPGRLLEVEPAGRRELPERWARIAALFEGRGLDELLRMEPEEPWQERPLRALRRVAPVALRIAFELIDAAPGRTREEASAAELERLEEVFATEDAAAGLSSVGGPRPRFVGR